MVVAISISAVYASMASHVVDEGEKWNGIRSRMSIWIYHQGRTLQEGGLKLRIAIAGTVPVINHFLDSSASYARRDML